MKMSIISVTFILQNICFYGQHTLPQKDTVIYKNGYEIKYEVGKYQTYMTTFKDGRWNGPFKAYYKNGKLWCENNRINDKIEGKSYEYTPNGDTALIEEYKNSVVVNRIIFYQSTKEDSQKYFFVSKKGYSLINNGVYTKLGATTPDSILEKKPGCVYIWLNGKRVLYSGKEPDKITYQIIKTGDKPGYYRVQGKKMTFIRALTKEEMK